jgi:hypothetical protein
MRRHAAGVIVGVCVALAVATPARADGPGVGTPNVVTLGDSAISGEAGRWAGNTNNESWRTDALGSSAYWDTPSGESIPGCHRSKAAQAFIGGGIVGANLACSGAKSSTTPYNPDEDFKPGIDFYDDGAGHQGQAKRLQAYAATHNVKAVVLMIGANDYGFAAVVEQCVQDWILSPSWWKDYCYDDSSIASRFTASNQSAMTARVKGAFQRVAQAMSQAGYSSAQYTVIAQTYWSPIPRGSGFRYAESGWTRQSVGGCGTWNRDADWANDTVVAAMNNSVKNGAAQAALPNVKTLDLVQSLNGHRLCENTVGLLEEKGLNAWTDPGASDKTEWAEQIRTTSTVGGPYQLQEDGHANYWGQKAMRNCLRLAYNGGATRGGICRSTGGVNAGGEPNMSLS